MPSEGTDTSKDEAKPNLNLGRTRDESSPLESSGISMASLAAKVLAEITRLSGYVACQGCGGLLESPALLGGCAHSVCGACTKRASTSRDPLCPVRGCALPLTARDVTSDTATSHTVECVRLLEETASELEDVVKRFPHADLLSDTPGAEDDWLGEIGPRHDTGNAEDALMVQSPRPQSPVAELVQKEDDTLLLCLSKLSSDVRRTCESICRQFGIEYVCNFPNEKPFPALVVTELESRTSDRNEGPQAREISFSILLAMIRKLPIVSPAWLCSCDEQGRIVAKEQFMASTSYAAHSQPVFDGVVTCFDGSHETRVKSDIARLIVEGGGKVVDSMEELGSIGSQCRLRLQVALDSSSTCIQSCDVESLASASDCVKRVDFAWLSGCVLSGVCPPESRHIFETCLTYSPS
jgi:hypothetical protein